jgi:hypothetical protein
MASFMGKRGEKYTNPKGFWDVFGMLHFSGENRVKSDVTPNASDSVFLLHFYAVSRCPHAAI